MDHFLVFVNDNCSFKIQESWKLTKLNTLRRENTSVHCVELNSFIKVSQTAFLFSITSFFSAFYMTVGYFYIY